MKSIFVGNLPWSVTDADLEAQSPESLQVSSPDSPWNAVVAATASRNAWRPISKEPLLPSWATASTASNKMLAAS